MALPLMLIVSGCASREDAPERTVRLAASLRDGHCAIEQIGSGNQVVALDQNTTNFSRWRGWEVHVIGDVNVPYRCVGGLIFNLQRAGAGHIGFIAEPPKPDEIDPASNR